MNQQVNQAIMAHGAWKAKFRQFMSGTLDLDAAVVGQPYGCDFGKWLKASGRADLGENFAEIDKLHAEFHRVAGEVVKMKKGGNIAAAEAALGLTGAFSKASSALVSKLSKLG